MIGGVLRGLRRAVLMGFFASGAMAACPELEIEPVQSVQVEAIWAFLERRVQAPTTGQLTTALWLYDEEFGRLQRKHGLDRVALLLAGAGDIGEQPLALDVYCKLPCDLFVEHTEDGTAVLWRQEPVSEAETRSVQRCSALKLRMVEGSPRFLTSDKQ